MIDRAQFEIIKQKHGGHASWAIWANATERPKSNIGDMSILDIDLNKSLLCSLRNNVIMVGLNISRSFSEPFRNFHDANPRANDFKIRYAFQGTDYYGAYMTDIIKYLEQVNSKDVIKYLKTRPDLIKENINTFREELRDINSKSPTILTFGVYTYRIILENMSRNEYSRLIKLTHYSHQISKEKYRETILCQIALNC